MIYTVTLNPSLDYLVQTSELHLGKINRAGKERILPGGKGINVSVMLQNLGLESTALGFIAGFTGDEIERSVRSLGCKTDFIRLTEGFSRINLKLCGGQETEINGAGPTVDARSLTQLFEKLDLLQSGDVLVLAGSIPQSMPPSIYREIMTRVERRNVLVVVDAARDALLSVLAARPFLIKPNLTELEEIFKVTLTPGDALTYAHKLRGMGARNVLISMAGDGAVFASDSGVELLHPAPEGPVVCSVGAGDSMVAGFLAGYLNTGDYRHAVQMGICAGSASTFCEGLATRAQIKAVWDTL